MVAQRYLDMGMKVIGDPNTKFEERHILLGLNNRYPTRHFGHWNKTYQSSFNTKCGTILFYFFGTILLKND